MPLVIQMVHCLRCFCLPGHLTLRPSEARGHTPHLGEHSREVLIELGYCDKEIDGMRNQGTVVLLERAEAAE